MGGIVLWSCEGAIFLLWSCKGMIFKDGLGCFCCLLLCVGLLTGCNSKVLMVVLKATCLVVLFYVVRTSSIVIAVLFGTLN